MKASSLKIRWKKFTRSAAARPLAISACVAAVLAFAVWTGIAAGPAHSPPAAVNSSLNLSEDADHYTVALDLPAGAEPQLSARLDGNTLHVASATSASGARVEQSVLLPQADDTQNPKFDRQKDRLVITVPKRKAGTVATAVAPAAGNSIPMSGSAPQPAVASMDAWNRQVMDQFQRMQQQMDSMMSRAMSNFGQADPFAGVMGNDLLSGMTGGGLQVQDKGDNYVIRANVPDDSLKNVNVSVDNDRVLKITSKDEASGSGSYSSSNFMQVFTLPGPVKSDKIQVSNAKGELVITLPKA